VDGEADDRDEHVHQQGRQRQARSSLGCGVPSDESSHGALGSIRTSVVELKQYPGTPQDGATSCRPGKKIGTGWLTRMRTDQATLLFDGGQSVLKSGGPPGATEGMGQSAATPGPVSDAIPPAVVQVPA